MSNTAFSHQQGLDVRTGVDSQNQSHHTMIGPEAYIEPHDIANLCCCHCSVEYQDAVVFIYHRVTHAKYITPMYTERRTELACAYYSLEQLTVTKHQSVQALHIAKLSCGSPGIVCLSDCQGKN